MDNRFEHLLLGQDAGPVRLERIEDNRQAVNALAGQATRTLDIFSRDLDPLVFNTAEFTEAVTQLAMRSRFSMIRVLVQDPSRSIKEGHRLIEVSYQLSSYIHIRRPASDYKDYNQAFLIADGRGLLYRVLADKYEGIVNFNAPLEAKEYARFFSEVWQTADIDPSLRRLHL